MGLEDLTGMDTPQMKGGRPTKEEQDDDKTVTQEVKGEPLFMENDEDWFWEKLYDRYVEGDELTDSAIMGMAGHTHTLPWTVAQRLDQFGVCEVPDELVKDDWPNGIRRQLLDDEYFSTSDDKVTTLWGDDNDDTSDDEDEDLSGGLKQMLS